MEYKKNHLARPRANRVEADYGAQFQPLDIKHCPVSMLLPLNGIGDMILFLRRSSTVPGQR
ncbi:MAG: hypothetical protein ACLTQI_02270 [Slackia sp.]